MEGLKKAQRNHNSNTVDRQWIVEQNSYKYNYGS